MLNPYDRSNHNSTIPSAKNAADPAKPKVVVGRYQPAPDGLTNKELKWGLWYSKHQPLLFRIAIVCLIVISAIFWIFSLIGWGNYVIFGISADQKLRQSLTRFYDYTSVHAHFSPKPIEISDTMTLPGGVDKYDAVAQLTNPNERFLVGFTYYFDFGNGVRTPEHKTILLPLQSRPAAYLGIKDGLTSAPAIVLKDIQWKRISGHEVGEVRSWQDYRLNFVVSDFQFVRSPGEDTANAHAISFTFTNNSPYEYVEPEFYVGLLQNQSLSAIMPLQLNNFKSLEARQVDLRNFNQNLNVTDVIVYPMINIYDSSVYEKAQP